MNQNFYEPNLCYNCISSDFDQFQPLQFPFIYQPPQEMSIQDMEDLKQKYLDEMKSLINLEYHDEINIDELKGNFNRMSIEINKKEKLQQLKHVANLSTYPSQCFNYFCYDDDEDYTITITPDFSIADSLIMENEHLDTIPETESDELIKSSVKNLYVPDCDDSQTTNFSTFSNPLFDDSTSSDDESSHEEVIHEMNLDSTPKNDRFDTKPYLLESLLNRDTLMASSPKFDSLLEEFSSELAHTDLIPLGINEANCDPEEDIHLVERLLYDNSSPRPSKKFNSGNSDAIIESFSPSPIPVEDSDSLMEEIDLFLTPDDSMPPGIENDDNDSEGYIIFLEEFLSNDSPSLPENESFHFDVPSSSLPPIKPLDDDEIEPDTGTLSAKVVGDIF
uniref:Reverse transcriptase domain-containing protein n=1 Tax=Tanacetum cinerariifolium TaxID=118510 RepID=A0A699KKQ6_TANCI|nr:hypothetical protein [Tanacetum cinerariifolium]